MNEILEEFLKWMGEKSNDYADGETTTSDCVQMACKEYRFNKKIEGLIIDEFLTREALDAGIPLSVIKRKTKLRDHFSEEYINDQCGRKNNE